MAVMMSGVTSYEYFYQHGGQAKYRKKGHT